MGAPLATTQPRRRGAAPRRRAPPACPPSRPPACGQRPRPPPPAAPPGCPATPRPPPPPPARPPPRPGRSAGSLAEAVGPEAKVITVADGAFLRDEETPDHVLIDDEWLAVTGIDGRTLQVQRGARGTMPAVHVDGARVRTGRTFRRVLALQAGRELLMEGGSP